MKNCALLRLSQRGKRARQASKFVVGERKRRKMSEYVKKEKRARGKLRAFQTNEKRSIQDLDQRSGAETKGLRPTNDSEGRGGESEKPPQSLGTLAPHF